MTRLFVLIAIAFTLAGARHGLSLRRMPAAARRAGAVKYFSYLALTLAFVALAALGAPALAALVALIAVTGVGEIAHARRAALGSGRFVPGWVWFPYGVIAALAVAGAALAAANRTLLVFAVIATFDGMCQVTGQWLGRRKLAPTLSPNKTVEGFLGGLVSASAAAAWLAPLWAGEPLVMALAAVPMAIVALGGDLSASWIKRKAGIKDYSGLIPGHGGVLDRFDGFLPNCALLACVAAAERLA